MKGEQHLLLDKIKDGHWLMRENGGTHKMIMGDMTVEWKEVFLQNLSGREEALWLSIN
jgi:hypothetical protein